MKLDNDVGGRAVQVRVTQGNEPRHFLKMFKGTQFYYLHPLPIGAFVFSMSELVGMLL